MWKLPVDCGPRKTTTGRSGVFHVGDRKNTQEVEGMTTLFEALDGEAQKDLLRDTIVECVAVVVRAVPDPDRRMTGSP